MLTEPSIILEAKNKNHWNIIKFFVLFDLRDHWLLFKELETWHFEMVSQETIFFLIISSKLDPFKNMLFPNQFFLLEELI